jgi:polysaccharide export outer membrane protein
MDNGTAAAMDKRTALSPRAIAPGANGCARLSVGMLAALALFAFSFLFSWSLPARAETADYVLGAGDLVRIGVFGYPDMTADVRVDESGSIRYALVGTLAVAGHSTREVETTLAQRLADGGFIHSPQVSVLITEYLSRKVAVMGEVAKPGQYALTQRSKLLDLLAEAGGVVTGMAADTATLLRADGSKLDVDLFKLFQGNPDENPAIAPGDTLYVPRASQFYVYGEVQRPGTYRLERRMTVSQAISAGGGLTPRGTERRAAVKRRDADGAEAVIDVRGSDFLQPDDVLLIKESLF